MIDLHTHSIFSDGELIPSELVRRAAAAGYCAIAITDHGDQSNLDFVIPRVAGICKRLSRACGIEVIPGIELTHVPPPFIRELVLEARGLGAAIVLVHGETIVEPVAPGTNAAALEAAIDILAHPGLIGEREVRRAADKGIYLEITTRGGHSLTNGHVAVMAGRYGARLVLNNDAHGPRDLVSPEMAGKIALGAGLRPREVKAMFKNSENLVRKVWKDKVVRQRVKKSESQDKE